MTTPRIDAIAQHLALTDRIGHGCHRDTVLALTEGALNLLQKAETLIAQGNLDDRPRALALIERAVLRLPDVSDTIGLPDVQAHLVRMHGHAAELRRRAEARWHSSDTA